MPPAFASDATANVIVACGLINPYVGFSAPTQRTACSRASVLTSDCAFDRVERRRRVLARQRPLALVRAGQREVGRSVRLDLQRGHLLRVRLENVRRLPLQRVGRHAVEHRLRHRHHERLLLQPRVHVGTFLLAEIHRGDRSSRPPLLSAVFSQANDANFTCSAGLSNPYLARSDGAVGHEIARRCASVSALISVSARGTPLAGWSSTRPDLVLADERERLAAGRGDVDAVHGVGVDARQLLVAQVVGLERQERLDALGHGVDRSGARAAGRTRCRRASASGVGAAWATPAAGEGDGRGFGVGGLPPIISSMPLGPWRCRG